MERDPKKRKLSQEFHNEQFDSQYKKTLSQTEMSKRENTQKSTLTEKMVSLWKTGSESGRASITTQESKDIVRLQEFETKYKEADKIIQSIKKKLIVSEGNVAGLNILLKKETTEKQSLLNKISTTWELIANISQHINCVTESLDRFQVHTTDLTDKYNNVIQKLRSENLVLQTEMKRLMIARQSAVEEVQRKLNDKEIEFNQLEVKCEILESQVSQEKLETRKVINELENERQKLIEMETVVKKMEVTITELEEASAVERIKLEQINAIAEKKRNEIQDTYELKVFELHKNFNETEERLQEVERSRVEMAKCLEEKTDLIANQDHEINLYQKQVRELMCQLTDTGLDFQRIKDEKARIEKTLEKKNSELCRLQQELETITMENGALTKERNKLNDSVKNEAKERMELLADLTQTKIQLQEIINHNNDTNENLHRDNEDKDSEVKKLQLQIEDLKQKLDQVLIDKTAELQSQNERLERKYETEIKIQREKYKKCLVDLDKLSDTMENMRKEDLSTKSALSSITMEREKLRELFLNEKETLEAKLFGFEELLAKKIDAEKELEKKISKLQTDLATAEKKYKDSESVKDNKILTLEKKLSTLGLSTVSQPIQSLQTRKITAKNTKHIHVQHEEIVSSGKIKSILKPIVNTYSPKPSPKASPKKISFNFGSDSSDDITDFNQQNLVLSSNDKCNESLKTGSHSGQTQIVVCQSPNPGTPTKPNKFFKSRGNL